MQLQARDRCVQRPQQQSSQCARLLRAPKRAVTVQVYTRRAGTVTERVEQSHAADTRDGGLTNNISSAGGLKQYQTRTGKSVLSAARSVKFHVRYKCEFGQEVFLVGSCAALGDWDVLRGLQLVWSPGHIWEGSVELPAGMHIQYKYVVRNRDGSVVRWQEGDNVSLELPGGTAAEIALDVEDSWNKSKQVKRILASGTPVRFNIKVKAEFGQALMVVGSCATLGNWNIEQAVRLVWQEGHVWEAGVDMPAGELVEYKYVIVNADGSAAEWQPGDNMVMEVPVAQGNTGRRRGVLVLDTWAKAAAKKPRAASAGAAAGANRRGSGAAARARGSPGAWRANPYSSTPAGVSGAGLGGGEISDASSALAARSYYSMMPGAAAIRDPLHSHQPDPNVLQHWTDKPRFQSTQQQPAHARAHAQEQHEAPPQARVWVPPPPHGAGPEAYARWQALQSVMSALQHSSELDHWSDDPTDPRMLAADRRLAALTASLASATGTAMAAAMV